MKSLAPILLIDNYDSFTYNLVAQFRQLGHEVRVFRNDVEISHLDAHSRTMPNALLVLSPGPGRPKDAGNLLAIIHHFLGRMPMLGICLGHQALVESQGGKVVQAKDIVHGKAADITLTEHPIFAELPRPLRVARYHSLVVENIPDSFVELASIHGEAMAVLAPEQLAVGFQFHPESILTTLGDKLISQTIDWLTSSSMKESV